MMKKTALYGLMLLLTAVSLAVYVWFASSYQGALTRHELVMLWFIRFILAVFLVGVAKLAWSIHRLHFEDMQLAGLVVRRAKLRRGDAVSPGDRLASLLPDEGRRRGLMVARIHKLWESASRSLDPQQEALREADEQSVDSQLALPHHIATISVLIGLLGTLYGLSLAVWAIIDSSNAATDFAGLQSAVLNGLDGAKTAFYTSIAGILNMLLLSTSILFVRSAWSDLLDRANRFVELDLVPYFFRESGENKLTQLVDSLERTVSELSDRIEALARSAQHIQNSFGGLISVGRSFEQGAHELLSLRDDMRRYLGQSTELQRQFTVTSERLVGDLGRQIGLAGDIHEKMGTEIVLLRSRQESLDALEQRIGKFDGSVKQLPEQVAELIRGASGAYLEQLQQLNDTYLQYLGPTGDRLFRTSEQLERFACEALPRLQEGVAELGLQIQQGVLTSVGEVNETVRNELGGVIQQHQQTLGAYVLSIEELKGHISRLNRSDGFRSGQVS
jgi:biopolymer transport protein ExbB/TolQ/prefoldin subunit 5